MVLKQGEEPVNENTWAYQCIEAERSNQHWQVKTPIRRNVLKGKLFQGEVSNTELL